MFGKYAYIVPIYYNSNTYDIHRRSVWVWHGHIDMVGSDGSKRISHKPLYNNR
jgi:hypothetical protein